LLGLSSLLVLSSSVLVAGSARQCGSCSANLSNLLVSIQSGSIQRFVLLAHELMLLFSASFEVQLIFTLTSGSGFPAHFTDPSLLAAQLLLFLDPLAVVAGSAQHICHHC
jgi:hypothetical protein